MDVVLRSPGNHHHAILRPGDLFGELLRPEGPIVFAGEHLSYVPFWQEGAALSAHAAMRVLAEMGAERAAAA